jgi:hypothetical protein
VLLLMLVFCDVLSSRLADIYRFSKGAYLLPLWDENSTICKRVFDLEGKGSMLKQIVGNSVLVDVARHPRLGKSKEYNIKTK